MRSIYFRRLQNKISYRAKVHNFKLLLYFIVVGSMMIYSLYLYSFVFKPILSQLSTSKASQIGQLVINTAVDEVIQEHKNQENLLTIEKTETGQVSAVVPNVNTINSLKSEIALKIQQKLAESTNSKIYIPLGNVSGIDFLSNFGPRMQVDLIPYGKATVNIQSKFTEAGINQTRHQMFVSVKLNLSLLLPNKSAAGAEIETAIPMSETIIVGNVPNSYTNVVTDPEDLRGDLLNIVNTED